MASIQCTQNDPTHTAIQWDGTNAQEIVDQLLTWHNPSLLIGHEVDGDGVLHINFQYDVFDIQPDGWLVGAPAWGGQSGGGPFTVYTAAEFTARFTAV